MWLFGHVEIFVPPVCLGRALRVYEHCLFLHKILQKPGNGQDKSFILCAGLGNEISLEGGICALISPLSAGLPCDTDLWNSPAQNFCFSRVYFLPEVPFVSLGCRAGSRCGILNTEVLADVQLREREQGK